MYKSLIKRRLKIRKNANYIRHISKIIKIQCCIRQYIARKRRKEKEEEGGKLVVKMEYVKTKAKRQYKSQQTKQKSKRNRNKDKGQMKGKEIVRDYEYE